MSARLFRYSILLSMIFVMALCGCTSNSSSPPVVEDTSASGAAGQAAGGALSGSEANGTLAKLGTSPSVLFAALSGLGNLIPNAWASSACPTFKTASGSGCTDSGTTMWLDYSDCSFGSSAATWSGVQAITRISGAAVTCGTFPTPASSGTLLRQYVTSVSGNTPGSVTITSSFGTVATVDDVSSNLSNFDGDTFPEITSSPSGGGYGALVIFGASGTRTALELKHRIYVSGSYDHSLTQGAGGPLAVTETAGATSRTVSGSLIVYHNLLKVIGTATFNTVIHSDDCCQPTGGSISTKFDKGANVNPTVAGELFVGKTETLTFTGCGTATYTSPAGVTTDVKVSRCF
jgi:hypothetical protein